MWNINGIKENRFDCYLGSLVSYANHINIDTLLVYLSTWCYRYNPTIDELINQRSKNILEYYYGIFTESIFFKKIELLLAYLSDTLSNSPVIISIDDYFCPWSTGYKKYRLPRHILILDIQKEGLLCLDINYPNKNNLLLPFRDLADWEGNVDRIYYAEPSSKIVEIDYISELKKTIYINRKMKMIDNLNQLKQHFQKEILIKNCIDKFSTDYNNAYILIHIQRLINDRLCFCNGLSQVQNILGKSTQLSQLNDYIFESAKLIDVLKSKTLKQFMLGKIKYFGIDEYIDRIIDLEKKCYKHANLKIIRMVCMKIKFVVFVDNKNNGGASWIGLGYLIAMIKQFYDYSIDYYLFDEVEKAVQETEHCSPDYIALPILQHNYLVSMEYLQKIKNRVPEVITLIGNILPSLYPKEIMELNQCVDYIIMGEGEYILKELLHCLSEKKDVRHINGIAFRGTHNEIILNPKQCSIQEIDELPTPDRNIYPHNPTAFGVLSSRGCEGNCTFCAARAIHKGGVRTRNIEKVLDEVEELLSNYDCAQIGFYDATFCCNKDDLTSRLTAICNGIKERGINTNIQINLRAEQISDEMDEIFQKFISVGLHQILVGFESGNDEDLKLYGKTATKHDNEKAAKYLNKLGCFGTNSKMLIEYGFINFNPYSTLDKLEENSRFLRGNGLPVAFKEIASNLVLYEGASICKKIRKDGLLLDNSMPFIIDTYNFRYQDETIESLHKSVLSAKSAMIDNVKKDFIMHFIVWRKHFGYNEMYETLFEKYIDYINKLSLFTLDFFDALILSYRRGLEGLNGQMETDIRHFLNSTEQQRKKQVSFQRQVFKDLMKKKALIIY